MGIRERVLDVDRDRRSHSGVLGVILQMPVWAAHLDDDGVTPIIAVVKSAVVAAPLVDAHRLRVERLDELEAVHLHILPQRRRGRKLRRNVGQLLKWCGLQHPLQLVVDVAEAVAVSRHQVCGKLLRAVRRELVIER